ncbi:hypothetical protein CfE428DRAFT_0305 [Chthoniobacter flavus Ellin428]|uniref:Ice-binding protein C-terminal domain-containing protein n=1 Tax=Chthoniobacter flavus Ellin428 TaxID=497964 RepID=B4CUE2_9BACT|nr:DNRLRE domain-containing protein [Chthoniobacter flavus]EDY22180.1 hypothetical protein CfE428DRAFT_0305 [Chthoniobacter flavus Ellin428]TCO94791.1 putative secreted protein with PEP-CTERM sorting signal [Chthoniobacter flavus]
MKWTPLLALVAFCAASVRADVVTIGAAHDTTIFQNNVNNAAGGGPGIFAGTNGAISPRRGLMSFDLSSIPAGATITNVQLTLTVGQIAGSGGSGGMSTETIGLFEITRPWGEGTAESGATSMGGTGQGAAAANGDATWNQSAFGQTSWTNPGGDFVSTASASLTLTNAQPGLSFTWLSTSQLVSDVQGWLDTPSTNDGWELINADEKDGTTFDAFYTREAAEAGATSGELPSLQVTFTVPEPTTGALMTFALLGMVSARRSRRRP